MGRVHQGGQVKASLLREQFINSLGSFAGIHDTQHLILPTQFLCQRLIGQGSAVPVGHPSEFPKGIRHLGAELFYLERGTELPE